MQRMDRGKCHTEDYHYAALLDIRESFIGKVGDGVHHIPYRAKCTNKRGKVRTGWQAFRENLEYRDTFTGAGDFDMYNLAWLIVKKKILNLTRSKKENKGSDAEGILCLSSYHFYKRNLNGLERSISLLSGLAKKVIPEQ